MEKDGTGADGADNEGGKSGLAALRLLWSRLHPLPARERNRLLVEGRLGIKLDPGDGEYFSEGDPCNLGVAMRMAVISQLLTGGWTHAALERVLIGHGATMAERFFSGTFAWVTGSNRSRLEPFTKVAYFSRAIAAALNEHLRAPDRPDIEAGQLFSLPFTSGTAVDDYRAWLRTGGLPFHGLEFLDRKHSLYLTRQQRRQDCLHDLVDAVIREGPDEPMIVNVYQRDMWCGLGTVAATLCAELAKDPDFTLPICYIPLGKFPSKERPAVDYAGIVGFLEAFYQHQELSRARRLTSSAEIEEVLLWVRRSMLRRPAVFVFDGYAVGSEVCETIKAAIRDNDVADLIAKLIAPYMPGSGEGIDYTQFRRNRIVVLSDESIDRTAHSEIYLRPGQVLSMDMPLPDLDGWLVVLAHLGIRNEQEIADLYSTRSLSNVQFRSENLLRLIDAAITIEKSTGVFVADALEISANEWLQPPAATDLDSGKLSVVRHIYDRLQARPLWRLLFSFIATAPGGVRIESMVRLIDEWRRLGHVGWRQLDSGLNIPAEAHAMIATFHGIIALRRKDYAYGFDGDAEHPWESPYQAVFPSLQQGLAERTIAVDFCLPEIRRYWLTALVEDRNGEGYRTIRAIHALLAAESLRQQTIMLRHAGDNFLGAIRGYRRLVQALYHGLLSLPSAAEWSRESQRGVVACDPHSMIPAHPGEAWYWLTMFAYRHMLERPPSWQLSRFFGADRLKLELIELIMDPIARREVGQHEKGGRSAFELLAATMPDDPRILDWKLDLEASRAQASHAVAPERGPHASQLLTSLAQESASHPRLVQLEKLTIDLTLVRNGAASASRLAQPIIKRLCAGFESRIEQHLSELNGAFDAEVREHNFNDQREQDRQRLATSTRKLCEEIVRSAPDKDLVALPDFLNRHAEAIATEAEMEYARLDPGTASLDALLNLTRAVVRSFAYFQLSDMLRAELASGEHANLHYIASGHAARTMIRVALRLEGLSLRAQQRERSMQWGYFARRARYLADRLTHHVFAFARERASLLIIESAFARLLTDRDHEAIALACSRNYLERAERVVITLDQQSRVRLRLRLERAKVNRRLSSLSNDPRSAEQLLQMARHDVAALKHEAKVHNSDLWQRYARHQELRNNQVSSRR